MLTLPDLGPRFKNYCMYHIIANQFNQILMETVALRILHWSFLLPIPNPTSPYNVAAATGSVQ